MQGDLSPAPEFFADPSSLDSLSWYSEVRGAPIPQRFYPYLGSILDFVSLTYMPEEGAGGPTLLLSPIIRTLSLVRRYCVCSHPLLSDTLEPERELGDESYPPTSCLGWGMTYDLVHSLKNPPFQYPQCGLRVV